MGMDVFQKEFQKKYAQITELNTYIALAVFAILIRVPVGIRYNYLLLYGLIIGAVVSAVIWHRLLNRYFSPYVLNTIEPYVDLALILTLILLTGGLGSIFLIALILPVMNSAGADNIWWNIGIVTISFVFVIFLLIFNHAGSSVFAINAVAVLTVLVLVDYRAVTSNRFIHQATLAYSRRQAKIEELTEINTYKDEFVYMATHEIRSPITIIRGYLDLLMQDETNKFSKKSKEVLLKLREHVESLALIVQEMLDISKIETGKVVVSKVKCDMNEIIQEVIADLSITAQGKEVILSTSLEGMELFVATDPDRLKEILVNLIENAIKYSNKGGEVMVSTKLNSNNYVEIGIKDSGIGIPIADQPHIFQKFFRANNVYEKSAEGTGLGLYIVYRLIDLLNGYIQFASEEGKGTTFKIQLPA